MFQGFTKHVSKEENLFDIDQNLKSLQLRLGHCNVWFIVAINEGY